MRRGNTCLLVVLALCLVQGPVLAEETEIPPIPLPEGTLNSREIRELFTDRTVHSITAAQGRESDSYYDPKGEVRQLRNGIKRSGRWRVSDQDRICLQMEDRPEKCRIIVNENGAYKKYIVKKNGNHQHSVSYLQFLDGNVMGL